MPDPAAPFAAVSLPAVPGRPAAGARAEEQSKSRSDARLDILLVGVCLALGLWLRIAMAGRSGMWRDEALFLFIANFPHLSDTFHFLHYHESHPPLFYLLTRLWLFVFGNTERAALALPVALGGAIIPVGYVVARRVFGRTTALIAALLLACSGSLADNASFMRPYSLLPLLCFVAVYLLWRGLCARGDGKTWAAYSVTLAALLYTHNWSGLILIAQGAVALFCLLFPPIARLLSASPKVLGKRWLGAMFLTGALYAPWVPFLIHQMQNAGHGTAHPPVLLPTILQWAAIMVPLPDEWAGIALASVVVLLLGLRVWNAKRTGTPLVSPRTEPEKSGLVAVILFSGIPVVAFSLAMALNSHSLLLIPRCEAILAPCILLLFAHALTLLPGRGLVCLLAVFATLLGFTYTSMALLGQVKSNARDLARKIAHYAAPSDLIVISPEWLGSSFNYYYAPANEQIDFPSPTRITAMEFDHWQDRTRDPRALAQAFQRFAEARRANRRVWIVLSRDEFAVPVEDDDTRVAPFWIKTNYITIRRSSQLLQQLTRLYGMPTATIPAPDSVQGDEVMVAYRFDPPAALQSSAAPADNKTR